MPHFCLTLHGLCTTQQAELHSDIVYLSQGTHFNSPGSIVPSLSGKFAFILSLT